MRDLEFERLIGVALGTHREYKEKEKEVKSDFEPAIEYLRNKYPDLKIKSRIKKTRLIIVVENPVFYDHIENQRLIDVFRDEQEVLNYKDLSFGGHEIKMGFW